jgi:hypothetical protein
MPRAEWFDRGFLEHAAKAPSQYDSTCRRLAQQILDLMPTARPLVDWHEGHGTVLWWRFPIVEPPYVGSPLEDDWLPGYHTHWTRLDPPAPPAKTAPPPGTDEAEGT